MGKIDGLGFTKVPRIVIGDRMLCLEFNTRLRMGGLFMVPLQWWMYISQVELSSEKFAVQYASAHQVALT